MTEKLVNYSSLNLIFRREIHMTIKDLYENAVKEGVENYQLYVGFRDDGGCYYGTELVEGKYIDVRDDDKIVVV